MRLRLLSVRGIHTMIDPYGLWISYSLDADFANMSVAEEKHLVKKMDPIAEIYLQGANPLCSTERLPTSIVYFCKLKAMSDARPT